MRKVIYKVNWDHFSDGLKKFKDGTNYIASGIGMVLAGGVFVLLGLGKEQAGMRRAMTELDYSADANFDYFDPEGNNRKRMNDEAFERSWNS